MFKFQSSFPYAAVIICASVSWCLSKTGCTWVTGKLCHNPRQARHRRTWRERLCVRERNTEKLFQLPEVYERERASVWERDWEVTWGLRKRESVCEREREKHWEVTWSLRERDGWCKPRYVTNKTDTRHDSLDANTNKNVSNNIFYFKPYNVYHDLSAPRGQNFLLRHYYRLYHYNNYNTIPVIRILGC